MGFYLYNETKKSNKTVNTILNIIKNEKRINQSGWRVSLATYIPIAPTWLQHVPLIAVYGNIQTLFQLKNGLLPRLARSNSPRQHQRISCCYCQHGRSCHLLFTYVMSYFYLCILCHDVLCHWCSTFIILRVSTEMT